MKKRFTAGVLLAIFTFLFLETEYLFVNIMGTLSNSRQAVSAQGIVLGVSVIGFVLYALFHRIKSAFVKRVLGAVRASEAIGASGTAGGSRIAGASVLLFTISVLITGILGAVVLVG